MTVEALTAHTGTRLAEVAFVLLVLAGIWMVAASRSRSARPVVAGAAIAVAGVLLIIATHWGRFG